MWQSLCGNSFVLWWSGTPVVGRGSAARSKPIVGSSLPFPRHLILLCEQGSAHGFQLFLFCFVHVWECEMEFVERLDNCGSHDQPRKPLVVRRNHQPGRVLRRRILDHFLVSFLVVLPEASFDDVGHGELPVLFRILEPLEEALLLLFL